MFGGHRNFDVTCELVGKYNINIIFVISSDHELVKFGTNYRQTCMMEGSVTANK
jgi:hypothetical protein